MGFEYELQKDLAISIFFALFTFVPLLLLFCQFHANFHF